MLLHTLYCLTHHALEARHTMAPQCTLRPDSSPHFFCKKLLHCPPPCLGSHQAPCLHHRKLIERFFPSLFALSSQTCVLDHLPRTACLWVVSAVWMACFPWANQAPLAMGFSRQEYLGGLPFPSPGDLPRPGIKPAHSLFQ